VLLFDETEMEAEELELIDGSTIELEISFEDSLADGRGELEVKVMTVVIGYEVVRVLPGQLMTFDEQLVMVKMSVVQIVAVMMGSEETETIEDDGVADAIEDTLVVQFMLVQLGIRPLKEVRSSAFAMS